MTPSEIKAVRERAETATAGPWVAHFSDRAYWTIQVAKGWLFRQYGHCYTVADKELAGADAEFIAHARTDIPKLLDYVAYLEQRLKDAGLSDKMDGAAGSVTSTTAPHQAGP